MRSIHLVGNINKLYVLDLGGVSVNRKRKCVYARREKGSVTCMTKTVFFLIEAK